MKLIVKMALIIAVVMAVVVPTGATQLFTNTGFENSPDHLYYWNDYNNSCTPGSIYALEGDWGLKVQGVENQAAGIMQWVEYNWLNTGTYTLTAWVKPTVGYNRIGVQMSVGGSWFPTYADNLVAGEWAKVQASATTAQIGNAGSYLYSYVLNYGGIEFGVDNVTLEFTPGPVPEPSSMAGAMMGFAGLMGVCLRRARKH